jgi:hypothetical protein
MKSSASTATIIRIPYVKDLANQADFLYATTDVALWSTAETGIGITASACATLRPLFRNFFSRSHLMGDTTSNPTSGTPWPKSSGPSNGYIRQKNSHHSVKNSNVTAEEFGLRSDIGKNRGVTTVIGSANDMDLERDGGIAKGGWNNSESKLTELSSDEEDTRQQAWRNGIRETTISTQVAS